MNILDKALAFASPEKALKRVVAKKRIEAMNTGYSNHGGSKSKKSMVGWLWRGGDTKKDIDDNLSTLAQRSRDLYMGAPYATSAIKSTRTNVVGSGLKLKAQIDYEYLKMTREEAHAWEKNVEREFALWADSVHCDAERMNNFYELQQIAFASWMLSGECFAVLPLIKRANLPYDLRIKLIEADRCATPSDLKNREDIINGVEVSDWGEVKAYYILNEHPLSGKKSTGYYRIEKFGDKSGRQNILHLMDAERPEQRRGVPMLAPVIESLKQLSRYSEAELMAAVVSGMFTVFIQSENTDSESNPLGAMIPDEDSVLDEDDDYHYELGNGAIVQLEPGATANATNPGRPNQAFDMFVTSICKQIGAALEIPFEILSKHFTSSYSASRAALLEAWKMYKMRRTWLANDFCQVIYEEWLVEGICKGRVQAPGFFNDLMIRKSFCKAEWNGPTQGQIDPLKEVKAAEARVLNGFSTRAKETQELTGGDYEKNIAHRKHEEELLREVGSIGQGEYTGSDNSEQS